MSRASIRQHYVEAGRANPGCPLFTVRSVATRPPQPPAQPCTNGSHNPHVPHPELHCLRLAQHAVFTTTALHRYLRVQSYHGVEQQVERRLDWTGTNRYLASSASALNVCPAESPFVGEGSVSASLLGYCSQQDPSTMQCHPSSTATFILEHLLLP